MHVSPKVSGSLTPTTHTPEPLHSFTLEHFNRLDFESDRPLNPSDLRKTIKIEDKKPILNNLQLRVTELNVDFLGKANLYKLCSAVFLLIHDFCAQEQSSYNKTWSLFGSARRDSNIKYNVYLNGVLKFLQENVNQGFVSEDAYNLCILFTHTNPKASTNDFTKHGETFVKNSLGFTPNKDPIVGDIKTLQEMRTSFSSGHLLPELVCLTTWQGNKENKSNPSEEEILSNVSNPQSDEVKTPVIKTFAELAHDRRGSLKKVEGLSSPKDEAKKNLSQEEIDQLSVPQRIEYLNSLAQKLKHESNRNRT